MAKPVVGLSSVLASPPGRAGQRRIRIPGTPRSIPAPRGNEPAPATPSHAPPGEHAGQPHPHHAASAPPPSLPTAEPPPAWQTRHHDDKPSRTVGLGENSPPSFASPQCRHFFTIFSIPQTYFHESSHRMANRGEAGAPSKKTGGVSILVFVCRIVVVVV
jgi:hypothetical protein